MLRVAHDAALDDEPRCVVERARRRAGSSRSARASAPELDPRLVGLLAVERLDARTGLVAQPRPCRRLHQPAVDPLREAAVDQVADEARDVGVREPGDPRQVGDRDPVVAPHQPLAEREPEHLRGVGRLAHGNHVEHLHAGHRPPLARVPQHEPVARRQGQRAGQAQPGEAGVGIEHPDRRPVLARTGVHLHAPALDQLLAGDEPDRHVDDGRRRPLTGAHQRVAPGQVVVVDPGEVERDPVAGSDRAVLRASRSRCPAPAPGGRVRRPRARRRPRPSHR